MRRNKASEPEDAGDTLVKVVQMQNALSRAIAERDEAMNVASDATGRAQHFEALAERWRLRSEENLAALETDVRTIGAVISDRMSATAVIGLGNRIMQGRSAVAALVTGALVEGYASAKEPKPGIEDAVETSAPDAQ